MTEPAMPDMGDPKQAAAAIAAAAVSRAVERGDIDGGTGGSGEKLIQSPTPPTPPQAPVQDVQGGVATPPQGAGDNQEPVSVEQVEAAAARAGVSFDEMTEALESYGIVVDTSDVPQELQEKYLKLLESTKAAIDPVFLQEESVRESIERVEEFKRRLEEKPDSILLGLWATNPDVFSKVAEIAERAKEDPEYKATVLKELEVEARESQVAAREQRFTQNQRAERGRRAAALTKSAAAKYGVDQSVAETVIASMVQAQGPDRFDLSTIDGTVSNLKPAAARPKPPPHVPPATQQAVQQTPTTPAGVGSAYGGSEAP